MNQINEVEQKEKEVAEFVRGRIEKMGVEIKQCRFCGEDIFFMKTNRGKIVPVSFNLVIHFYDCPKGQDYYSEAPQPLEQPSYSSINKRKSVYSSREQERYGGRGFRAGY